jgi:hypothetical protein
MAPDANEYQQAEHRDMVQGKSQSDGLDHISRHQQIQSQQHGFAQLVLITHVGAWHAEVKEVAYRPPA